MQDYIWPKIVWTAQRSWLLTDHGIAQPITKYPADMDREYLLGPTIFVRALHWSELHQVYPFTARFSKFRIWYLPSINIQVFKIDSYVELLEEMLRHCRFSSEYCVKSISSVSTDPNEVK